MKRSIKEIEYEIVNQIFVSELCFNICNSIATNPRGGDFIPYYYNLNFIKGLISLHSLLLSKEKDELSIGNYIIEHKKEFPGSVMDDFENNIGLISKSFENSFPIPLRHKIAAHIAESFDHTTFTSGYIMPTLLPIYTNLVSALKGEFFSFTNRSDTNIVCEKIKEQSDIVLKTILENY